jgi:hypothetical protein
MSLKEKHLCMYILQGTLSLVYFVKITYTKSGVKNSFFILQLKVFLNFRIIIVLIVSRLVFSEFPYELAIYLKEILDEILLTIFCRIAVTIFDEIFITVKIFDIF